MSKKCLLFIIFVLFIVVNAQAGILDLLNKNNSGSPWDLFNKKQDNPTNKQEQEFNYKQNDNLYKDKKLDIEKPKINAFWNNNIKACQKEIFSVSEINLNLDKRLKEHNKEILNMNIKTINEELQRIINQINYTFGSSKEAQEKTLALYKSNVLTSAWAKEKYNVICKYYGDYQSDNPLYLNLPQENDVQYKILGCYDNPPFGGQIKSSQICKTVSREVPIGKLVCYSSGRGAIVRKITPNYFVDLPMNFVGEDIIAFEIETPDCSFYRIYDKINKALNMLEENEKNLNMNLGVPQGNVEKL